MKNYIRSMITRPADDGNNRKHSTTFFYEAKKTDRDVTPRVENSNIDQ